MAIAYDFITENDDDGLVYPPDLNWGSQYSDVEELSLRSGEAMIQPLAEARGGYVIELDTDLRSAGIAYYVESCYFDEASDEYTGVIVENELEEPSPPDDSGVHLPETGGIGTTLFTITGGGLIVIALIVLAIKKRRRA